MPILEFFPNEFHWIQSIQWIITKSKNCMVTRGITHLATNTSPVVLTQSTFPLLPLARYLLPVKTLKIYHARCSNGNFYFTTTSRIISIVRYRVPLVTMLLLSHLVSIRWVQWKSFRENSNATFVCLWKPQVYKRARHVVNFVCLWKPD